MLVAGSIAARGAGLDRADFDAVTSCGPAGIVTLWIDAGPRGCGDHYPLVHGDGAQAVGLPSIGETANEAAAVPAEFPGDELLGHRIALHEPVPLAGTTPERTIERTCRTSRASRDILAIVCEGPDPEAACTGTLTLRERTP